MLSIPMKSSTCSGSKNLVVPASLDYRARAKGRAAWNHIFYLLVNASQRSLFYLPHRLTLQVYSVCIMNDAIKHCVGHRLINYSRMKVFSRELAGDYHGG
jgi:hypothetical protein